MTAATGLLSRPTPADSQVHNHPWLARETTGLPSKHLQVLELLRRTITNDTIFKGEKILVPKALCAEMLVKILSSHLGINKMKQRAREILFWPGLATDSHQHVAMCPICAPKAQSNLKEPLLPHAIPSCPDRKSALTSLPGTTRTTSGWWHWLLQQILQGRWTAKHNFCCCHQEAVSSLCLTCHSWDNEEWQWFTIEKFKVFAMTCDIEHITSSPGYPQFSGLIEKYVQINKNILDKARSDGRCAVLSILEYRNTPVDSLASPAQLLMGQQLHSILPTTSQQLKPKTVNQNSFVSRPAHLQEAQKTCYNQTAHPLSPMKTGYHVYVQMTKGDWRPAKITAPCSTPWSFNMETEDGTVYHCNHCFLRHKVAPRTPSATAEDNPRNETSPAPSPDMKVQISRYGWVIKPPQKVDL